MFCKYGEKVKIGEIKTNGMSPINKKKFEIKRNYFYMNGYFRDEIILDRNNNLLDGYSTYLLALELNLNKVLVKRAGGKLKRKKRVEKNESKEC